MNNFNDRCKKIRLPVIVLLALINFPLICYPDEFSEASKIVDDLHHVLVEVMQDSAELGYAGRYQRLDPVISARFDTPLIVKVILSRYWKEMDDTQKNNFIDLFNKLSISTYASRFDNYDNEKFIELSREKLKRDRILIKTELQRTDDEPVKLDYLMHQKNGAWLIISVIADGVNDLSLKRAEYASVIKEKGFPALVEKIQSKIIELENDEGS